MDPEENTNVSNGIDAVDIHSFRSPSYSEPNTAPLTVHKDAAFYKMDHPQRGLAVIFNHEVFLLPDLKDRSGTMEDEHSLKNCWEKLGFTVVVHKDLETKQLMNEIDKLSKIDYSDMDCLVICVLSHGDEGVIFSKDSAYKHEKLWEKFTADKCKSLAGKPKLFFIQACQGRRFDPGVHLQTEVDSRVESYKIPIHADFLFAYSTIPGTFFSDREYITLSKRRSHFNCLNCFKTKNQNKSEDCSCGHFSWRNTTRGSWFIQALCGVLQKSAFLYDLLTLLTFVIRRVATEYESNVPGDVVKHAQKQIPCVTTMLTRFVQFTPKRT